MRRLIAPCACALALFTGVWAGQAYTLFAPLGPIGAEHTPSPPVADTVWSFYDAIDLFFRAGDDAALRAVVSPEFVDHVDTPGSLANREGFFGYLASLRTTHPALRLVPTDVIAQGDRAIAEITLSGDTGGAIKGIPLGGPPPWPEVEIVRVEDDRIVERWGGPAGYASSTPVFSEAVIAPSRGALLPFLHRVTFAPGANDANLDRFDPAIVTVESGQINVGTPSRTERSAPMETQTLGPGNTLAITEKMDLEISNRTDAPAVILLLSLAQPAQMPTNFSPIDADDSIEIWGLAGYGTVAAIATTGGLRAEMAEVTLAPGMRLSTHDTGLTEFVVVEAGTLTAAIDGQSVTTWLRDPRGRQTVPGSYTELAQGFGLSVSGEGASTSYRNESSDPVTFLLVTLSTR